MGHSKNRGRRRLTLPLPLRAKMIGLAMFIGGFMGLIASAQLDPITAHVEPLTAPGSGIRPLGPVPDRANRPRARPRSFLLRISRSTLYRWMASHQQ